MRVHELAVAACALCSVFLVGRATVGEPWEVKDSKGRVRITTIEDGNSFVLVMLDGKARPRLTMECRGDDGRPSVRLYGENGKEVGAWSQSDPTAVAFAMKSPEGPVVSLGSTDKGSGLSFGKSGDPAHIALGIVGDRSALELTYHDAKGEATTSVLQDRDRLAGLLFTRGSEGLGGVNMAGAKGLAWFGANALDKGDSGPGVRVGWDPATGPRVSMQHSPKGGVLSLQCSEELGNGWGVTDGASAQIRGGIAAHGTPTLLVTDKAGAVVLKVPESK